MAGDAVETAREHADAGGGPRVRDEEEEDELEVEVVVEDDRSGAPPSRLQLPEQEVEGDWRSRGVGQQIYFQSADNVAKSMSILPSANEWSDLNIPLPPRSAVQGT